MGTSALEEEFASQLRMAKIKFAREVKGIEGRKFLWDFYIGFDIGLPLLIEINGGTWVKSGHSTGTGLRRDAEKLCLATLNGYHSMVFTGDMVKDGTALKFVQDYLRG